ncbi:hypothetical protein BC937DRAFT_95607 [Endogone sp. FLAS-F59071]|nr:hypothetical protein BC937DRAFT_95607 [Endogone sp. FLAS-F59071]|eukprot:RUS13265.1 hypothetical protein BC937DRAFT_95607 [Endogone sp. FLAS-F59071]
MWLYDSLQEQAGTPAPKENIICDAWVDHDLFMISRYDINNVYHIHQDFMHVFLGYGLMDLNPDTTEIIFLDSDAGGIRKSHAIWKQAFSGFRTGLKHSDPNAPNVIRTIRDLASEKFEEKGNVITDAYGKTRKMRNLCLRSATFSVHGGLTLLSRQKGKISQCDDAPMLRSFADFMLTRLNLPTAFPTLTDPFNPAAPRDFRLSDLLKSTDLNVAQFVSPNVPASARLVAPIIITFLTRRPVDGRSLERTISNEYDLIKSVNSSLETLFTLNQVRRPYLLRVVDFGTIPTMREQIAIARESDILLGPHGAALVYSIYLPPHGCLIELQHPSRRNNFQFRNILALTGRDYSVYPVVDPLRNIQEIADSVAVAVAKVLERRID